MDADSLRRGLAELAGEVAIDEATGRQSVARRVTRRRHRRAAAVAAPIAVAAAVVAAVVAGPLQSGGRRRVVAGMPAPVAPPRQYVTVGQDPVSVVSTADGTVIRRLWSSGGLAPMVTASADSVYVIYQSGDPIRNSVIQLAVAGAPGAPVVGENGRVAAGADDRLATVDSNRITVQAASWPLAPIAGSPGVPLQVTGLAWSPDGASVAAVVNEGGSALEIVDTTLPADTAARVAATAEPAVGWMGAAWLDDHTAVTIADQRIVALDTATGDQRTLVQATDSRAITSVDADPVSGEVLYVEGGTVYRWHEGMPSATPPGPIGTVSAAAWVPAPRPLAPVPQVAIPGAADPGGLPSVVKQQRTLWFADRSRGWMITGYSSTDRIDTVLRKTTDGGRTWTPLPGVAKPMNISFLDADHGWVISQSQLYRTENGGRSWDALGLPPKGLLVVQFVDPTYGWAVTGKQQLVRSLDGGTTWTAQPVPEPVGDTCFVTTTHGWAETGNSVIETTDGGDHWSTRYTESGGRLLGLGGDIGCSGDAAWIAFPAPWPGAPPQPLEVARSINGGPWQVVHSTNDWGYMDVRPGVAALSLHFCYPCQDNRSRVTVTTDGGASFADRLLPSGVNPIGRGVTIADASHWWIASAEVAPQVDAMRTILYATSDGGRTWQKVWTDVPG
ncbi:MAG: hypothetical protein QOG64_2248 [Acidimicrobiaceae bacterium]|nr:hypothetical protein [Acidimicrobiaceae bacterium]